MKLSMRDFQTLLAALEDAISDRESFLDAHVEPYTPHGKQPVYMDGYEDVVRRTKSMLKRYFALRKRVGIESKKLATKKEIR